MEVADRFMVINEGVIAQIGSPGEQYEKPASDFVYHFLGDANRFYVGDDHHVLFRPHEIHLSRQAEAGYQAGEVGDIRPLGAISRVTLKVAGQSEPIEAEAAKNHLSLANLASGETLYYKPKAVQPVSQQC